MGGANSGINGGSAGSPYDMQHKQLQELRRREDIPQGRMETGHDHGADGDGAHTHSNISQGFVKKNMGGV